MREAYALFLWCMIGMTLFEIDGHMIREVRRKIKGKPFTFLVIVFVRVAFMAIASPFWPLISLLRLVHWTNKQMGED